MQRVRKAVFPVAGAGTRFLPATKAMPKELLPIIDKPIVQYAVEEAVAAGITELVFVTGRTKRAIEDHFDANPELEALLRAKHDEQSARSIRNIVPTHVRCIFVRQPEPLGLGHAILCAKPVIGREPFAVLLADDVVREGLPTKQLIDEFAKAPGSILCHMTVLQSEAHKYGILSLGENGQVLGLVEKPSRGTEPSLLASIGRYVLEPDILEILENQPPGHNGEIQLADAINSACKAGRVRSVELSGQRYDCGSKLGYLEAILDFALQHPEYGQSFSKLLLERSHLFTEVQLG